ncbi:MAG: peptidase M23 [Gammaproteobacteria bacterium]|nr:MAG: peptidase M23 [Gammaproteobacteria bacterium]
MIKKRYIFFVLSFVLVLSIWASFVIVTDDSSTTLQSKNISVLLPRPQDTTFALDNSLNNDITTVDYYVKTDDTFFVICQKLKIKNKLCQSLIVNKKTGKYFKILSINELLSFVYKKNKLIKIKQKLNSFDSLTVNIDDDYVFNVIIDTQTKDTRPYFAQGVIDNNFYSAAITNGIDHNIINQFADIFGWQIDFTVDTRKGHRFSVLYEKIYSKGIYKETGRILAGEYKTKNKAYRAVLYRQSVDKFGYFTVDGKALKKAFMRYPLEFTRISSNFNLKRRHPLWGTVRPHKGVDYAAKTGTEIKSTADGKIILQKWVKGYGKTVVVQHGGNISTLYAHMSNYAKGIKKNTKVRQGQIIGYVGQTGWATGPHLHYEFRVNLKHKDPVTVPLPKIISIVNFDIKDFKKQTASLISQLKILSNSVSSTHE